MKGMNIDNFKKVSENEKTAVLEHPRGHRITIAKKALSPKMRAQLEKLPIYQADGTQDPNQSTADDQNQTPMAPTQPPPSVIVNVGQPQPSAPPVSTAPQIDQGLLNSIRNPPAAPSDLSAITKPIGAPNVPNGVPEFNARDFANMDEYQAYAKKLQDAGKLPGAPATPAPGTAPTNFPIGNATPASTNAPNPMLSAMRTADEQYGKDIIGGGNLMEQGARAGAEAVGAQGEAMAQKLAEQATQVQKLHQDYKTHFDAIDSDVNATLQDYKDGHINPSQFWENKSVPGKISTALGLILGGAAAGAGQENPALKFLNQQIDRNIDAQKANLANKGNVLSALFHQQGNLRDAVDTYRAMNLEYYAAQLNEIKGKFAGPIAQAAANEQIGKWRMESASLKQGLAFKKAFYDNALNSGAGGSSTTNPAVMARVMIPDPKHQEEALKEIGTMEKVKAAHDAIDQITTQISKEQTLGNRVFNPVQSKQKIDAYSAQLIPLIQESDPSKRLTPDVLRSEIKPLIQNFMTNPKTAQNLNEQLHNLVDTHSGRTPTLDAYGLSVPRRSPRATPNKNVMSGYSAPQKLKVVEGGK